MVGGGAVWRLTHLPGPLSQTQTLPRRWQRELHSPLRPPPLLPPTLGPCRVTTRAGHCGRAPGAEEGRDVLAGRQGRPPRRVPPPVWCPHRGVCIFVCESAPPPGGGGDSGGQQGDRRQPRALFLTPPLATCFVTALPPPLSSGPWRPPRSGGQRCRGGGSRRGRQWGWPARPQGGSRAGGGCGVTRQGGGPPGPPPPTPDIN